VVVLPETGSTNGILRVSVCCAQREVRQQYVKEIISNGYVISERYLEIINIIVETN